MTCLTDTTICVTNEHGYVPFVITIILAPLNSWLTTIFLTRVTCPVEQEMLTLPEHLNSPLFFCGVRVVQSLLFCVVFCTLLCVPLSVCHCIVCSLISLVVSSALWYLQPCGILSALSLFISTYISTKYWTPSTSWGLLCQRSHMTVAKRFLNINRLSDSSFESERLMAVAEHMLHLIDLRDYGVRSTWHWTTIWPTHVTMLSVPRDNGHIFDRPTWLSCPSQVSRDNKENVGRIDLFACMF